MFSVDTFAASASAAVVVTSPLVVMVRRWLATARQEREAYEEHLRTDLVKSIEELSRQVTIMANDLVDLRERTARIEGRLLGGSSYRSIAIDT